MDERRRKRPLGLLYAAALAGLLCGSGPALAAPNKTARPASRKLVALLVEHDDLSAGGTTRHLIRATVPVGLSPEELRRNLDLLLDEERLIHPQVEAVALYLYEEPVYARFRGRTTPLNAAVAHAEWAPVSGNDNRIVYTLPGPSKGPGPAH